MLQLKNISKTYIAGDMRTEALKGVDLEFRKNDFVSILGPSGCGKTTMLNIIGGLDRYTSGDLVINGVSTKEYKDVDWDIYRNKSIGFVFQSYNLISHQTVFANVELALTLAGTSHAERRRRVTEVLEKVGLGDQLHKKPTQLSGGQMQRVAIARALVNNPDILLADEPTGALDSGTSVQIMEILEEIAKDRLVIMVTHNSEIAEKYSTRIIKLLDGQVVSDSNPFSSEMKAGRRTGKRKKISMSFPTALALSFKNLMTKKTRTILTAFAGSIGIIGIALILSLSSGMQNYVNDLERDTLSTYPIELQSVSMDMSGMMSMMMDNQSNRAEHELDKVYSRNIMTDMMSSVSTQLQRNDLQRFKEHIESDEGKALRDYTNTIQYGYDVELQIYNSSGALQVNPSEVFERLGGGGGGMPAGGMGVGAGIGGMGGMNVWAEMLENKDLLDAQYDVVAGNWPQAFNEVVIVVNSNNEISDMTLYALGLLNPDELDGLIQMVMRGEEVQSEVRNFSYDEILSTTFKLLLNTDYYEKEGNNWADRRDDDAYMQGVMENAVDIRIVGIVRPAEEAAAASIDGSIGYTSALTNYVIEAILETDIAKEQLADPETDVLTGIAFDISEFADSITMDYIREMIAGFGENIPEDMPEEEAEQYLAMIENMPNMSDKDLLLILMAFQMDEEEAAQFSAIAQDMSAEQMLEMMVEQMLANADDFATYEGNLTILGIADFDSPSAIRLYPKDFDSKQRIETLIADYNEAWESAGQEEYVIHYTDFVGLMTASISSIIGIVSYVLIAFVSISLIVSSIMIAIITYISVLERTKEIGILRSIGASKKDITRVFNAETIIEGLVAGGLGVGITMLLNFPINAIIKSLADVSGLAVLPLWGALGLIVISVILTLIAGFIPSKMAAKKDPVEALRTE